MTAVPGMTAVLPVGKQVMMVRPSLYIYCLMDILVEWNEISKSDRSGSGSCLIT